MSHELQISPWNNGGNPLSPLQTCTLLPTPAWFFCILEFHFDKSFMWTLLGERWVTLEYTPNTTNKDTPSDKSLSHQKECWYRLFNILVELLLICLYDFARKGLCHEIYITRPKLGYTFCLARICPL